MRVTIRLLTAAALAVGVAGCGAAEPSSAPAADRAGGSVGATPPTTGPTTSPTTPRPTTAPAATSAAAAVPPGARASQAPAAAPTAYLTDVRVGAHPGYDRVVFAFRGPRPPGYAVRYVRPPVTQQGSGQPVRVAGSAYLEVRMTPASGADLSGAGYEPTYTGPARVGGSGAALVAEVVRTGDFEGTLTWVVGLRRRASFSVDTLSSPGRVVVDVRR